MEFYIYWFDTNYYLIHLQKCQHRRTEIKDASSAKNFAFDDKPSARSLIRIMKRRGPKIDTRGTPALTPVHEEICPFRITLCFLSFKESDNTLSRLPEIPFCFSSEIKPLCQTLSNAIEISRKTPLTSNLSSKDVHILWFIDKS